MRDGGINISINVATVPASEFPETASKYVVQREFRLWKTPGKLLYLCALILQAQSFRRSFAFPLLMAAPFWLSFAFALSLLLYPLHLTQGPSRLDGMKVNKERCKSIKVNKIL